MCFDIRALRTRGYRRQNAEVQKTMICKLERVIYRLKRNVLAPAILRWFAVGSFTWLFRHTIGVFEHNSTEFARLQAWKRKRAGSDEDQIAEDSFSSQAQLPCTSLRLMVSAAVSHVFFLLGLFWHTSTEDARLQAWTCKRADSYEQEIAGGRFPSQAQLPCKLLRLMVSRHLWRHLFDIF